MSEELKWHRECAVGYLRRFLTTVPDLATPVEVDSLAEHIAAADPSAELLAALKAELAEAMKVVQDVMETYQSDGEPWTLDIARDHLANERKCHADNLATAAAVIDWLAGAIRLARAQQQGCGGNLTHGEALAATIAVLDAALSRLAEAGVKP